ncbi:carbohydrate ABC transporter permease [Paenibacillus mucilaginosus]|uniref:Sugar permease n=3 Tax=Paenibacillus mucilaginosus TaxID=61624 RepID=H6NCU0_9BACL|nr:carbohydrate ABC transporter permease [Paenibacillus mucilaginosus]AEI40829.1 Sugar permease [Paenibacillus mucilaginosus KNP414]AFC29422.1 Sugar permease [Paenibacillus mucilaginosus 3016]AFH61600.1 sugar ABC transporter permease [Paenibacillus mucilaginosus K02]MCG7211702.1 carbohydrate ABC transporter permease [Paenibacillus mucilaginosus]WDM29941.1 carbohydrate ABC transporter permease [Paenibacillus mucilaginosus]
MELKASARTALYLLLFAMAALWLFPVLWIVLSSFKTNNDLYSFPPRFWPEPFTFEHFTAAFEKGNFGRYFINSAIVTVSSTILLLLINSMAGFALAKYQFTGATVLLVGFVSTLMVPLEVIMIPIFKVLSVLGLFNTLLALIIPPAATPTGVFLLRQYLLTVPEELLEAARMDGASEWRIYSRIILPICKPILAVLAIFSFMWRWDDFLWPLIGISDPSLYTIQLALSNFIGEYNVDWGSLLAMSVITMIPVLVVFILFQRQFVSGMVTSGMK